jgi:hypothetical protein
MGFKYYYRRIIGYNLFQIVIFSITLHRFSCLSPFFYIQSINENPESGDMAVSSDFFMPDIIAVIVVFPHKQVLFFIVLLTFLHGFDFHFFRF